MPYEGSLSSLILDNWLAAFLQTTVPSDVSFWGIYDCCHSGDIYKAAIVSGLPPADPNEKPKQLDVKDLVIDKLPARLMLRSTAITTKALILDGTITNSFHFGAAEPDKSALCKTIGGVSRSVFTYALEQVIQVGQTVGDFEKAVTAESATVTTAHIPQIACPAALKNRAVFS